MGGIDSNTVLMLHLNNDVVDSSTDNYSVTNTNVTFANTSPNFAGTYYGVFDGIDADLTVPTASNLQFGNSNFTVDFWLNPQSGGGLEVLLATEDGNGGPGWWLAVHGNTGVVQVDGNNSTLSFNSTSNVTFGAWNHIALVRNGNVFTLYINGTAVGTQTISINLNGTLPVGIGKNTGTAPYYYFTGSMQEIRISNIARWTTNFTPPTSPYTVSTPGYTIPSALSLTTTLLTPSLQISKNISISSLNLTTTLLSPMIVAGKIVYASPLSLLLSLKSPTLHISSTVHASPLSLTTSLKSPVILGSNTLSYASKILSFNPLIIVSNTSPMKISVVNVSSPDTPTWVTYTIIGANNAKDVVYNSVLNTVDVACADGTIVEFNASNFALYTIISTGASGNLTSLANLPSLFNIYAGTDYNTGEVVDIFEGNTSEISTDIRFNQVINQTFGTYLSVINGETVNTDLRWNAILNNNIGCDIRFIVNPLSSSTPVTPIATTDFHIFVDDIELTDVKLDSIIIRHHIDEKSEASFILARQHDNVNYTLDETLSEITNHNHLQIYIAGNLEFDGYIWDVSCKSDSETVLVSGYTHYPQEDNRKTVTLSLPSLNEKLSIYHALIHNPIIDNPFLLANDITPPFYLGIQIDAGYDTIETCIQERPSSSIGLTNVPPIDGLPTLVINTGPFTEAITTPIPQPPVSGSQAALDLIQQIQNGTFKPIQNWTYFWFVNATNFSTGVTVGGTDPTTGQPYNGITFADGLAYIGTSLSSLTSDAWQINDISFLAQRVFPNEPLRLGSCIVYPSDFIGIVPPQDNPIAPGTIDQILRNDTGVSYTGLQLQQLEVALSQSVAYSNIIQKPISVVRADVTTKVYETIDSKLGIFFGQAPYKKVSARSGIYVPQGQWQDAPNGLNVHYNQGYDYTEYINQIGRLEFKKIQNINGSVLPKTKADVEIFLDNYYFNQIAVLTRINIDNTVQNNIYNNNNGFPVSVKSIEINSKTMKVTLICDNQWSRLELLEIEGTYPDPNSYVFPATTYQINNKFDLKTLTNTV